jgi:hypothetical protein
MERTKFELDVIEQKGYSGYFLIVADYINKKIFSGTRYGITDYEKFIEYVRKKYPKQMTELDAMYSVQQEVEVEEIVKDTPVFVDQFGNVRAKTVFDV